MNASHPTSIRSRTGAARGVTAALTALVLAVPSLARAEGAPGGAPQVAAVDPANRASEPAQPSSTPPDATPAPTPAATPPAENVDPPPALAPTPLLNESPAPATTTNTAPPVADATTPTAASGAPAKPKTFEVAVRAGYGLAFGNIAGSQPMGDYYAGSIPIIVDGWWHLPAGFAAGLYGGLGFGLQGKALDGCDDCSLLNFRVGLQAAKHFNRGAGVDPWVSVGIGYEATSVSESVTYAGYDYTVSSTYNAFPELTAALGVDFGNDTFAIGPFASVSYASYSKASQSVSCASGFCGTYTGESEIDDTSGHGWLMLGVRTAYMR